jgi:hypothetical protein
MYFPFFLPSIYWCSMEQTQVSGQLYLPGTYYLVADTGGNRGGGKERAKIVLRPAE